MNATIDRVDQWPDLKSLLKEHPEIRECPTPEPRAPGRTHRPVDPARGTRWRGVLLLGLWVVTISTIVVTEPVPSDPNAPVPAWAALLAAISILLMPAVLVGLVTRARWGFAASLAAAGALVLLAVGCFATEHHAGLYPYGEAAAFAFLGFFSCQGLRRA